MKPSDEPPAASLNTVRLVSWQAGWTLLLVAASLVSGRGAPASILAGAALLAASFVLQARALRVALARQRPAVAVALLLAKVALLLGIAVLGLSTALLEPMSFAVGASTVLLAIFAETCYRERLFRRRGP